MQDKSNLYQTLALIGDMWELDSESAIEALGGSEEVYEELLWQIMRLMDSNIESMDEALRKEDLETFGIKMHGAKGVLRQAGCLKLARSAETLETIAKDAELTECMAQYPAFRKDLLCFHEGLKKVFNNYISDNDDLCEIEQYKDVLIQAKTAIQEYDILLAAELLFPLRGKHFGEGTDYLLKQILDALASFHAQDASDSIEALFNQEQFSTSS